MQFDIEHIIENGKRYARHMQADKNGRFRSWEHCYTAFAGYKGKPLTDADLDLLCLHLAFYLASWGMYRGSAFLLQKDYRVHAEAVRELMRDEYRSLWAIKCERYLNSSDARKKLDALSRALRSMYSRIRESSKALMARPVPLAPVSDTLITKILMGTMGCVPAYDQYFRKGILSCGIAPAQYNTQSILNLSSFYAENEAHFEDLRHGLGTDCFEYPQMKILDMCFWQTGVGYLTNQE